jgi:hypothetical protein
MSVQFRQGILMGLNKTKKVKDWCPSGETKLHIGGKRKVTRCPTCNKRLLPMLIDLEPYEIFKLGNVLWAIPPHKAK